MWFKHRSRHAIDQSCSVCGCWRSGWVVSREAHRGIVRKYWNEKPGLVEESWSTTGSLLRLTILSHRALDFRMRRQEKTSWHQSRGLCNCRLLYTYLIESLAVSGLIESRMSDDCFKWTRSGRRREHKKRMSNRVAKNSHFSIEPAAVDDDDVLSKCRWFQGYVVSPWFILAVNESLTRFKRFFDGKRAKSDESDLSPSSIWLRPHS